MEYILKIFYLSYPFFLHLVIIKFKYLITYQLFNSTYFKIFYHRSIINNFHQKYFKKLHKYKYINVKLIQKSSKITLSKKKTNVQNKQILILKRKYPPQDLSQFVSRIYHRNNSIKMSLRHKKNSTYINYYFKIHFKKLNIQIIKYPNQNFNQNFN